MVSAAMELPFMAETPPGDDALGTTTTRVAVDLMDLAKQVCAHTKGANGRPIKLSNYLDSILRPAIKRDHAAAMRRVAEGQRKAKKPAAESDD